MSRTIGQPFKKNFPDSNIISKDARDTQYQVANLMSRRGCLDAWDIAQSYERNLKSTLNRDSLACSSGFLYPEKLQKEQKELNKQSTLDGIVKKKEENKTDKILKAIQEDRRNKKGRRRSVTAELLQQNEANKRFGIEQKESTPAPPPPPPPTDKKPTGNVEMPQITNRKKVLKFKNVNF